MPTIEDIEKAWAKLEPLRFSNPSTQVLRNCVLILFEFILQKELGPKDEDEISPG